MGNNNGNHYSPTRFGLSNHFSLTGFGLVTILHWQVLNWVTSFHWHYLDRVTWFYWQLLRENYDKNLYFRVKSIWDELKSMLFMVLEPHSMIYVKIVGADTIPLSFLYSYISVFFSGDKNGTFFRRFSGDF